MGCYTKNKTKRPKQRINNMQTATMRQEKKYVVVMYKRGVPSHKIQSDSLEYVVQKIRSLK